MIFAGAISNKAKTSIREVIRTILIPRWSEQTLECLRNCSIQRCEAGLITTANFTEGKC